MGLKVIGKVVVASAGTPQKLNPTAVSAQGILVQALSANTGKIFVGDSTLNKTTLVGCYAVLAVPTANVIPSFSATQQSPGGLDPSLIFIDADNTNDGVLVSVLQG